MKGKWLLVIVLVIVFSGGRMAMAQEWDQKMPSTSSLNENGNSEDSMEGMDMSGAHNMDGHDMGGMDMKGSGHSHGPVIEKQANLKVLGTYGAVNLSFIVIGVWNKWFRRKDDSVGSTK